MQFIWVMGASASGKTTLIKKILDDPVFRRSMGINPDSCVVARLSNFGIRDINNTSSDDIAKSLMELPCDVVLIKGQNNYKGVENTKIGGLEVLKKLIEIANADDSIRLILLFPCVIHHAQWYWGKYNRNEELWKKGDRILQAFGRNGRGLDAAAQLLKKGCSKHLKNAHDIRKFANDKEVEFSLEIRDSSLPDYPTT